MLYDKIIAWTFNLMLFGGDLILLVGLVRSPKIRTALTAGAGLLGGSVLLAAVLGTNHFFVVRLIAYALFLHMPIVLIAAAFILWRQIPRFSVVLLALAGIVAAIAVDAFLVEPHWLMETRTTITSAKIQQPLRVAIIADLQTDEFGEYERQVFRRCLEAEPDIILMAGDYLQIDGNDNWDRLRDQINSHLREINFSAPLGVYAVQGNIDHQLWVELFNGLPVNRILETKSIDSGPVRVTGLEVWDSFDRNLEIDASQKFHIVLGHAPDFALGKINGDLLVAGHTHGGQVCLPLIGPLMTASQVPRSWANGITKFASDKTLIVSRGIGMERQSAPRLRFLCRPELVVVDVVPEQTQVAAK